MSGNNAHKAEETFAAGFGQLHASMLAGLNLQLQLQQQQQQQATPANGVETAIATP